MPTQSCQLNCLVVDDEPLAQNVLAMHISKIPTLRLVQKCSNAIEAFEALHKHEIDLLFLDINMPVISGLNFLRSLKNPPAVILTTAYTEHAMDSYALEVVDYLLKPIPFDRFLRAVKKATALLGTNGRKIPTTAEEQNVADVVVTKHLKDYFFVKSDGKLVKIDHSDIKYIEGLKDYLKIYTKGQTIVCHQTMKAMEELLPAEHFMRVHKSYIVALSAIKSIAVNLIFLNNDRVELPLGSTYRDALIAAVS